jgi:glutathione S-transferase
MPVRRKLAKAHCSGCDAANRLRRFGDADWLGGAFNAGDLLIVAALLRLKASSGLVEEYPNLSADVARGEARAAYKRAFAAQLAVVTGRRPTG